jgi:GTP-binding protein
MKFIDQVQIQVRSGKGGQGCASFRREKKVPRGGPDGGDGGKGGNVIFRVSEGMNSLLSFTRNRQYYAGNGEQGKPQNQTGSDGNDIILEVPAGTIVRNQETGLVELDLDGSVEEVVYLEGGLGGKGNTFFKNSVNQAPTHFQPGLPGEHKVLQLELKLMADVGIIGYPNAGKSTLISHMSAAKPKIADYPFTTLTPSLGVVEYAPGETFVLADIPGIIKDAHKGTGLGTQFLKHIERTRCFIHLVDASYFSGRDPVQDYKDIQLELELHDQNQEETDGFIPLSNRRQIVVLNKIDAVKEHELDEIKARFAEIDVYPFAVSAATGHRLKELALEVAQLIKEDKKND